MAKALISVVDDERIIGETLVLLLRTFGYEAKSFVDPAEALVAIRQSPPDMLIADVELPGMAGTDLAIALIEQSIPTKILLFSGHPNASDYIEQASHRGYDFAILAKPVSPALLRQSIEEALR